MAASTVLFAVDFVIAKHLLRGLATLTVMTARMTLGSAILFVYVIGTGRLAPASQLTGTQWAFVLVTALVLLAFTITTFTAIQLVSVSAVLAIGSAAPIITTLVQVAASGRLELAPADLAGLAIMLVAVMAIMVIGIRQDSQLPSLEPAAGPGRHHRAAAGRGREFADGAAGRGPR